MDLYSKAIIIARSQEGVGVSAIAKELSEKSRGDPISYGRIRRLALKYRLLALGLREQKRFVPRTLTDNQVIQLKATINDCLAADSSATSSQILHKLYTIYGFKVHPSYVNKMRRNMGYRKYSAKYCQLVRDVNKVKRMK